MGNWVLKCLGVATAVAVTLGPAATSASAKPVSIRGHAAQEVHLATIAYQISKSARHHCSSSEYITGLVIHDLSRYDHALRPAISNAFSVNRGFGVLGVVPGSVAELAGLQVDDEILAVGHQSVADEDVFEKPKSFERMESFNAIMQAELKHGPTNLLVRRGTTYLRVNLMPQAGCGGALTLTPSAVKNAWSDGRYVIITTAMVQLSRSDDELAFVIAHEMAHNILGHASKTGERRAILGLSRIKGEEIEADSFAVRLMIDGGYRGTGGISFLQNASRRLWWNVSLDHPGFGRRIRTVSQAMTGTLISSVTQSKLVGQRMKTRKKV